MTVETSKLVVWKKHQSPPTHVNVYLYAGEIQTHKELNLFNFNKIKTPHLVDLDPLQGWQIARLVNFYCHEIYSLGDPVLEKIRALTWGKDRISPVAGPQYHKLTEITSLELRFGLNGFRPRSTSPKVTGV
ncbi:hypothetical protein NE237_005030 [Protea cynaroides]|uniref:Uncharacterized protein n=1 Tax=Protea cynaroides TaxID=273540 RepID=A0A9Q0KKL7_9MAGN|nr:hypothetical protein NE237_005030 [Protea cynaroides]